VGHQHGRGDSLSGNITYHEVQASIPSIDYVAIISADQAGRLVAVADVPVRTLEALIRQQPPLHACSEFQIPLERVPFMPAQVVEAETDQRIADKPVALDRFVACLTQPIGPAIEPGQGG